MIKNLIFFIFLTINLNSFSQVANFSSSAYNLCGSDSVTLTIDIVGGAGPFTAAFSFPPFTANLNSGTNNFSFLINNNSTFSLYYVSDQGNGGNILTLSNNTVNVVINPVPSVNLHDDTLNLCYGQDTSVSPLNINGSYPLSFDLVSLDTIVSYNNFNSNSTIIINSDTSNIYHITNLTDNAGCSGSSSGILVTNIVSTNVTIAPVSDMCENDPSIILSSGQPAGGIYKINNLISSFINTSLLGQGTHNIEYIFTNSFGCIDSSSTTFNINPTTIVQLNPINDLCKSDSALNLNQGQPVGGFYVLNGDTITMIAPNIYSAGNYTIGYTYINSYGCASYQSDNFMIYDNPVINLNLSEEFICKNAEEISLNFATPIGGNYSINGSSVTQINPQIYITGTNILKYEYIDNNGCFSSKTDTFIILSNPELSLTINQPLCYGSYGSVNASVINSNFSYQIFFSGNSLDSILAGTYQVSVIDSMGCKDTQIIQIINPQEIEISINNITDNTCYQDSSGSLSLFISGGTLPYNFNWTGPNGYSATVLSLNNLKSGLYNFQVEDKNNCQLDSLIEIKDIKNELTYSLGFPNDTLCEGEQFDILVNVSGSSYPYLIYYEYQGAEYSVSFDGINNPFINLSNSDTILWDRIVDSDGCEKQINFATPFIIYDNPNASIFGGGSVCNLDTSLNVYIEVDSTTVPLSITYLINDDTTDVSLNGFLYDTLSNTEGVYKLISIQDGNGCESNFTNQTTSIDLYPEVKSGFILVDNDNSFFENDILTITNIAKNYTSISWDLNGELVNEDTIQIFRTLEDTGIYTITQFVENQFNCKDTMTVSINVYPKLYYEIPNSFSPNGDFINDIFAPIAIGHKNYSLEIYDRLGNLFYQSNKSTGWDGGGAVTGHYVYYIILEDFSGKRFDVSGTIYLHK